MKRYLSFLMTTGAAGLLAVVLAGHVLAAEVTEEKAKSIALENAGVKAENVTFIRAEQDQEEGKKVFEVEFLTKENEEYDYEILAETGEILEISYERKGAVTSTGNGSGVTLEQAEEIALGHANLAADAVTIIKKKPDMDDGQLVYEIEFYTGDYRKYEYEIDSKSGEIIAWELDSDSAFARQDAQNRQGKAAAGDTASGKNSEKTSEKEGGISLTDAKAAALKQADLKESQVTWGRVYKKYDDGRLIYKGEFFYNQTEYEFEIDALSGGILDWDVESISSRSKK